MPHFYRYRVEEDYSPLRGRTPAPTPSTARRTTTTTTTRDPVTADLSLLGLEANISVPAESDKTKVVAMFAQLDSAVRELREENKQLRTQLGKMEERISQAEGEVRPETNNQEIQDKLQTVISRCEASEQDHREVRQKVEKLEEMRTQLRELEQRLSDLNTQPVDTPGPVSETQPAPVLDSKDDLESVKSFVTEKLSGMKDLVSGPLSVVFDAVRSDDFVGEDNFLTFSKFNVNLGAGLDVDTGRFTAPVGGVYLFLLNVYGAPRDPVVLSLRLNEMKEVSSCSGVGKASQSCILDLNTGDTVGVFVNDKTKLSDSEAHRYTHFAGILLRPDNVRF